MNQPTVQYPLQLGSDKDPSASSNPSVSGRDSSVWAGRVIGEYEVQRLIGQGGSGEVYAATHRWLKMPVAIKVLQHVNTHDKQALDRFQREAQIAAKLRHANLVRCTDGGVVGEKLFLVTDFVDGEDLRSLVHRRGPLPVAEACEIIRQVSIALQFIFEKDTIHRDIKPANIMLDRDGTARVLDMGLARCAINQESLTQAGQVMGTLDYIAPEQAVDSRDVDFRADLYSLGCTFYFLLAGQAPFSTDDSSTLASKILAHLESDPPPLKSFRRDLPRSIIGLIDQMLQKAPESRPDSFCSVSTTLTSHAEGHRVVGLLDQEGDDTSRSYSVPLLTEYGTGVFALAASLLETAFCSILVVLGFLDRRPAARTGQIATYHPSFRWLKAAMIIGLLGTVYWFWQTGLVPVEKALSPFRDVEGGKTSINAAYPRPYAAPRPQHPRSTGRPQPGSPFPPLSHPSGSPSGPSSSPPSGVRFNQFQ